MGTSSDLSQVACFTPTDNRRNEFLVFSIGEDYFGVDIRSVQELCNYGRLTRLIEGNRLVEGIAALNGLFMPMVDLRMYFRSGVLLYDELTSVIIVCSAGRPICLIVDCVFSIANLAQTQIEAIPSADTSNLTGVVGLGKWQGKPLILLDIDTALPGLCV